MARRDYGTGSITKRGPDRWQLRWYGPPDPLTGDRKRKTETITGSKTEASQKLAAYRSAANVDSSALTLEELIGKWRAEAEHELGTQRNYDLGQSTIPARVLGLPLDQVKAATVRAVVSNVHAEHGPHRARLVHAVMSGALSHAWRQEWIASNPARKVVPPAAPKRPGTQPSRADVDRLLAAVADDAQLHAWLRVSAMAGARPAEILALHWADFRTVTLDTPDGPVEVSEINIDAALDPIDNHLKGTKTEGQRMVPLGPITTAAVQVRRVEAAAAAEAIGIALRFDAFIFSDVPDGTVPWRTAQGSKRYSRIRQRLIDEDESAQRAAGIDDPVSPLAKVRLYDLRHHFATELLGAGADPKAVADLLGHTRVATTTDTYGHAMPARHRELTQIMERPG